MIAVDVHDASGVGGARREAAAVAEQSGLKEADGGRVALVATELATNLVKHGGGGEILVGAYEDGDGSGVEVLALDRGPGIANLAACLEDGYSSAGTAGNGLGAVFRQSDMAEVASWPGVGTAVLTRFKPGAPGRKREPCRSPYGAVSVAMAGEQVCGDSWTISTNGDMHTLCVADGLGHGSDAAEAAVEAVRVFHRFNGHQVATLLDYIHGGLRATRGAAVSIARFDPMSARITFAGIGNVAGAIVVNGEVKRMVSMPGTAGYVARKIQSFEYAFDNGLVILHSDGLTSNWTLARYPNLHALHPTLIAAVLYRDFCRRRDDATVLVGKWVSNR